MNLSWNKKSGLQKMTKHPHTIIASLIVLFVLLFLFLFALQPTGIYNMSSLENKTMLIIILALNFVINIAFEIFILLKKKVSVKKLISIHVIFSFIIIFFSIVILYVRHTYMTKQYFFRYLSTTFVIVSFFQILIFYFFKNRFIDQPASKNNFQHENKFVISDNKTSLNLSLSEIIFIKSEGNYITVYEQDKDHLIRATLKKVLKENNYASLIRCHKSYIINTDKIKSITGNSKGYKVLLHHYDNEIPVSVEMGKKIKELFN